MKMAFRLISHNSTLQKHIFSRRIPYPKINYSNERNSQVSSIPIPRNRINHIPIKRTITTTNKRWKIELQEKILSSINIQDPLLQKYIRTLGWIHVSISTNDKTQGFVELKLKLPTLLHPYKDKLVNDIMKKAKCALYEFLDGVGTDKWIVKLDTVALPILEKNTSSEEKEKVIGINKINHILAVYSCKGGVGKSTIAINLAYALSKLGGRIGVLDCDIYGPSLPTLLKPVDTSIRPSSLGNNFIKPIEHDNIKFLSLGYVSTKSGVPGSGNSSSPTVLKGHMANKVITQLLYNTQWDELDILLLDLPPGTGDIPIYLLQQTNLKIDGVVSITTPSKLSLVDTIKGIDMFYNMNVPTLVCIENMAFFEYKGDKLFPFGKGLSHHHLKNEEWRNSIDKRRIFSIPLSISLNDANEEGKPLCGTISSNDEITSIQNVYKEIAQSISKDLFLLQHDITPPNLPMEQKSIFIENCEFNTSSITLSSNTMSKSFVIRLFSIDFSSALEVSVSGNDLRIANPKTGVIDGVFEDKTPSVEVTHYSNNARSSTNATQDKWNIFPVTIEKKGNFGYAIHWADGATIIYSMNSLANLAKTIHEK